MAIDDDVLIDATNKLIQIRTTVYSVNAVYSHLQDRFDEPDLMDDDPPMLANTPTEYTMINGWFLDDESIRFLTGGAMSTTGWTGGVIRQVQYDASGGSTPFSSADIGRTLTGTTTGDQAVIVDYDVSIGTDEGWLWLRPVVPAIDLAAVGDIFDDGLEAYTLDQEVASQVWQSDNEAAWVDNTAAFNSAAAADWSPLPALAVFNEDSAYFGFTQTFSQLRLDNAGGTAGVGGTIAWQYYNGTTWIDLSGVTDGTTNFTIAVADDQVVLWTVPTDWAATIVNGSENLFYVRALQETADKTTDAVYDQGYIESSAAGAINNQHNQHSVVVFQDDNGTFADQTFEFNSATAASWSPYPTAEVVLEDSLMIGYPTPFNKFTYDSTGGTQGVGGVVNWEYWDGSAWVNLTETPAVAGDQNFTTAVGAGKAITWTPPADWAAKTDGSGAGSVPSLYYIRGNCTTVWSTNPVLDSGFITPVSTTGESLWTNGVLIGTLKTDSEYYFVQERIDGLSPDGPAAISNTLRDGTTPWYGQDAIDVLVKVREAGELFNLGFVTTLGRQPGRGYSDFTADLSAGGRVSIPLSQGDDFNTVQGFAQFAFDGGTGTFTADEIINRAIDATADAGAAANSLLDVSQTFLTDGVRAGDVVRNTADVETGAVLTVTETLLTTSGLATTLSSKAYEIDVTQYKGRIQGGSDLVTPTGIVDIFELGDLTSFANDIEFRGLSSSADAIVNGALSAVNGAVAGGITLTYGATQQDIDDGGGSKPYDCIVNCNSLVLLTVYERLQYLCRRGSTDQLGLVGDYTGRNGEHYLSTVEQSIELASSATDLTEGLRVEGQTSNASAICITMHNETPEFIGLKEIHGTFVTGETVTDSSTGTVVLTIPSTASPGAGLYAIVSAAPFGSLAGGKVFGARGVYYSNLNAADVQNFQLIDSEGNVRVPPNTVTVTVNNIAEFDFVSVFVLLGAGLAIDKDQFGGMTATAIGDATVLVGAASIATDNPATGVLRIIDTSAATEERYRYASRVEATGVFTLDTVTGAADAPTSGTVLTDAVGDFVANGVEVADQIRNVTDGNTNIVRITDVEAPTGDLFLNAIPTATDTVIIVGVAGTRTYKYEAAPGAPDDIDIGGSVEISVDNLVAAINLSGTDGVTYGAGTTINADYTASKVGTDTVRIFAANKGTENDAQSITETMTDGASVWDNATTSGKRVTTEALSGGTTDDWVAADTYQINYISKIYTTDDNLYAALIDLNVDSAAETAGSVSNTLKFSTNIFTTVRTRQGKVILPFESPGTITSGGLIVPTIRTTDTIAT